MELIFCMGMHLDNILDELDGQGHRSKVKVIDSDLSDPSLSRDMPCDII